MASNTNLIAGAFLVLIATVAAFSLNKSDPIYKLGFAVVTIPVVLATVINTPVVEAESSGARKIPWGHIGKALQYLSVAVFGYILFAGN